MQVVCVHVTFIAYRYHQSMLIIRLHVINLASKTPTGETPTGDSVLQLDS